MARSTVASAPRRRRTGGLLVAACAVLAAVMVPATTAEARPLGEDKPGSYQIAITDAGVTGIPDRWFSWDWTIGAGFEVRTAVLENQTSEATAVTVTVAAPATVFGDPRLDGSYYCWDSAPCQTFAEMSANRATIVDAVVLEPGASFEYSLAFGHLTRHPKLTGSLPSLTRVDMAVTAGPVIAEPAAAANTESVDAAVSAPTGASAVRSKTAASATWMGSIVDGIAGWFRVDR